MKRIGLLVFFVILPLTLFGQELIERIEIQGNDRVTQETILYYITAREGDYYNEEVLKRDFRVLWTTGFFADIRVESEDGAKGRVVRFVLKENPVIKAITFKTGKKLKEDDIVNKLKEKDQYLLPYSYYSAAKIQRIKKTIEELLQEKGLQAGKVETEESSKGRNEIDVLFRIDEGPKVRVGAIVFEGRPKLPETVLKSAFGANKEHNVYTYVAGKDVFKQNKVQESVDLLKKKFQEHGYMEATVGEPRIETISRRNVLFKTQQMVRIVVPVNAGYLYRVGEVAVDGSKAVSSAYLKNMITLKAGDIYSSKVREKIVENMSELYRNAGYLYAQVMPVENLDPKNKRVNVTFNIYEGEICYLNRLEFRGNLYTKDKVMRREMLLREGDRFSLALFKDSLLRMKQVGLVDLEKDPDVRPVQGNPSLFDVMVNVKELQRNNIQFTAGYSGYEGYFVALSYQTVNFLGAGENLDLTLQYGKRIKNYSFGFTEPYLFDYPISLGFNVYNRYIILPYLYDRKGKGADLIFGARLYGYWRTNLTYTYEDVTIKMSEGALLDPIYAYMYGLGNYKISSLYPVLYRSTVDSPLTPSRGTLCSLSCKFAGSFLGGEIDIIKPRLEFTHFQPVLKNHSLGMHVEYQFVRPLRSGGQVPFWEKFYMGGERDIRGYDIYTIGPRSAQGTNIGGDKSLVVNLEYIMAVGGPLYVILFHDMGNSLLLGQSFSTKNLYQSTGVEARIFVPALRIPFRLIFAYNNKKIYRDDTNFAFRFALGTTF